MSASSPSEIECISNPESSPKQEFQSAKQVVRQYQISLSALAEDPREDAVQKLVTRYCVEDGPSGSATHSNATPGFKWYGCAPFDDDDRLDSRKGFHKFLNSLCTSFGSLQRREDVFIAGRNEVTPALDNNDGRKHNDDDNANDTGSSADNTVWACSMGHFVGQFEADFVDIPKTNKLCFIRYCEFFQVIPMSDDELDATGTNAACRIKAISVFLDVLGIMLQAGVYPLPPPTGLNLFYVPGPRSHDGVIRDSTKIDDLETEKTSALLVAMLDNLKNFNKISRDSEKTLTKSGDVSEHHSTNDSHSGNADQGCPPEALAEHWHTNMLWFRENLCDKNFLGHVARVAEGCYEAWFGWPNLTNKATGGFLGLPASEAAAEMRVVDVYRREDDKLAENWVFIDMIHYLKTRGLDVLKRMRENR